MVALSHKGVTMHKMDQKLPQTLDAEYRVVDVTTKECSLDDDFFTYENAMETAVYLFVIIALFCFPCHMAYSLGRPSWRIRRSATKEIRRVVGLVPTRSQGLLVQYFMVFFFCNSAAGLVIGGYYLSSFISSF